MRRGRADRERRKYTFEGHATGCLEHDHLVALEAAGDRGPSASGSAAVTSRSPSRPACGASAGTNSPTAPSRSGSSATSARRDLARGAPCDSVAQLPHGPGDEDEPAVAAERPRRRDRRAEALRVGVVAVVEDRETALLEQLAPARRDGELLQRVRQPRRGRAPAPRPRPRPASRCRPGAAHATASVNVVAAEGEHRPGVGTELDAVGHQVGAHGAPAVRTAPGAAPRAPAASSGGSAPTMASGTPSVSDSFSSITPASEPNPSRCPATALVTMVMRRLDDLAVAGDLARQVGAGLDHERLGVRPAPPGW